MTEIRIRSDLPVTLIDQMGSDLQIAQTAWEDFNRLPDSPEHLHNMLRGMCKLEHGSVFERGALLVHVEAPLFVMAQINRHRIALSPNQRSARYVEMLPHFYIPDPSRPLHNTGTSMRPKMVPLDDLSYRRGVRMLIKGYEHDWAIYQQLLALGWAKESARGKLPENTYSGISLQFNVRSALNFLHLRVNDPGNAVKTYPQWETQQIADQIESLTAQFWPVTHAGWVEVGRPRV